MQEIRACLRLIMGKSSPGNFSLGVLGLAQSAGSDLNSSTIMRLTRNTDNLFQPNNLVQ
jgi:hypothetical protein